MERSQKQDLLSSTLTDLKKAEVFITYVPLRTEIPFRDFVAIPDDKMVYEVPPRAALDPFEEAQSARSTAGGAQACILLPGRSFDRYGTRQGQGGGWYDRFLSAVPKEWVRVGFCFEKQFSEERLLRAPWDEPMDYLVVVGEKGVRSIRTNARAGTLAA